MRAGRLKLVAVVAVALLPAVGYLVVTSTTGGGHGSESHSGAPGVSPLRQVEVVRDALSGAGRARTIRTERCPTQTVIGGYVRPPARVSVRMPAGADPHLVAYAAGSGQLLPAPERWECTAGMGADGNEEIGVGPIGSVRIAKGGAFPELRRHGPAVRATLIPGCEGCIATAICSFFPHSGIVKVYESLLPCAGEPEGETRYRLSRSTFLSVDPPGVRGSASGSGGSLPSMGVLSFTRATGVRQLGCTMPPSEFHRCVVAVVAFLALGRRR
jgi:hypothetical protein